MVRQFTARSRFIRACRSAWNWCKRNRHLPVAEQRGHLAGVVRGHCGYCGLTGNSYGLAAFRDAVLRCWRRWLGRRHRSGRLSWAAFNAIHSRLPLPAAKAVHSIYAK